MGEPTFTEIDVQEYGRMLVASDVDVAAFVHDIAFDSLPIRWD